MRSCAVFWTAWPWGSPSGEILGAWWGVAWLVGPGRFVGSRSAGSRGAFFGNSLGRSVGHQGVVARCSSFA